MTLETLDMLPISGYADPRLHGVWDYTLLHNNSSSYRRCRASRTPIKI